MDKGTLYGESPRDNVLSDDQEAGVAVVDIDRIEQVYRLLAPRSFRPFSKSCTETDW